jgi:hypothetical protein
MRVRTHLIAMPWAPPDEPSIQLGALKAHLDSARQGRADCRTYSAFFSILHDFKGRRFLDFFQDVRDYREYVYLPLYLRRFGPPELRRRRAIAQVLEALRVPWAKPLSSRLLDRLERATRRYLDRRVAPRLIVKGVNLVGFTLNFPQVYSSVYAAEHLRQRFPERHFLFVYGGACASLPAVYTLLADLRVPGVIVVGEGEKKLELLVRALEALSSADASTPLAAVAGLDPGIVVIGDKVDFGIRNPDRHASQVKSMSELALPDYDEYFAELRRACADTTAYGAFRAVTDVLMEGSRGCFAGCDFCGLNRLWHGFRCRSAREVMRGTLALTRKYRTSHVVFVDNVCDAWAAEYARLLVQAGIRQHMFMELRANHPERFWTVLALAGLRSVQVGVEALSPPLLKAMGKGTRVIDGLAAHKYLSELAIWPTNHLITHHPASTLADIRETRRILEQVPHWYPFRPTDFVLEAGSPLYEGLSENERAGLKSTRCVRLPSGAARYGLEYSFEVPERLNPGREVMRAWSAFTRRYAREIARYEAGHPRLDVARVAADTLRITDTRHGKARLHEFSGDAARIYDACHAGLTLAEIAQATGLSPDTISASLATFLRSKLVLRVEGHYLSVAVRPRDELLRAVWRATP